MDVSNAPDFSVPEYVNSPTDSIQLFSNHNQFLRDSGSIMDNDVVAELGNALSGILHVIDVQELVSDCTLPPDDEKVSSKDTDNSSEELELHQACPADTTTHKVLSKCATFPCSKKSLSHASVVQQEEVSDIAASGQYSMRYDNRTCTRSISLPTSLELVSALKGSREKQGTPLTKLTVTWASDVYDPPSTSLSHTVKGHSQHRSRTSKKNSKHKHKGKTSRGSSGDKKQYSSSEKKHYRRYTQNPEGRSKPLSTNDIGKSDLCLKSPLTDDTESKLHFKSQVTYERFLQGGFLPSVMDFVKPQESKCGDSFLRESMGKVHMSVAEAT